MDKFQNSINLTSHRNFFMKVGFAYTAFGLSSLFLQYLIAYAVNIYYPELIHNILYLWVSSLLPMYMISLPICAFIFKTLDKTSIEKAQLGFKKYLIIFIICLGGMYSGSFIGLIVTTVLRSITGLTFTSSVNMLILNSNKLYIILFAVILAPIVEEFLFRKLLIDRIVKYGELPAILLSGLLFGLFHGNFQQFFYADFLGMIFAYVYIKTGKLRYSISYHMIINFIGSIIPLLIFSGIDDATKQAIFSQNMQAVQYTPELLVSLGFSFLYSIIMFSLAILGVVLFFLSLKKITLKKNEMNLSKTELFKSIFINFGMLSFIFICIIKFILSITP